jgi:beta-lactamase superfamily II metal-dependent hydrolase
MRRFLPLLTLIALAGGSSATGQSGAARTLDTYYIDAEGGQSTLFVAPSGQVLLVDTWSGADRDPARILAALKAAGVQKIDHMLLTHYHGDHYGGLPQIAKQIPIVHFYDHGQSVEMDRAS